MCRVLAFLGVRSRWRTCSTSRQLAAEAGLSTSDAPNAQSCWVRHDGMGCDSYLPDIPYPLHDHGTARLRRQSPQPVSEAATAMCARSRPGVPYNERVHVSRRSFIHSITKARRDTGPQWRPCATRHVQIHFRRVCPARDQSPVRGSTDGEWIYALLLSQLDDPGAWPSIDTLVKATRLRTCRPSKGSASKKVSRIRRRQICS